MQERARHFQLSGALGDVLRQLLLMIVRHAQGLLLRGQQLCLRFGLLPLQLVEARRKSKRQQQHLQYRADGHRVRGQDVGGQDAEIAPRHQQGSDQASTRTRAPGTRYPAQAAPQLRISTVFSTPVIGISWNGSRGQSTSSV